MEIGPNGIKLDCFVRLIVDICPVTTRGLILQIAHKLRVYPPIITQRGRIFHIAILGWTSECIMRNAPCPSFWETEPQLINRSGGSFSWFYFSFTFFILQKAQLSASLKIHTLSSRIIAIMLNPYIENSLGNSPYPS